MKILLLIDGMHPSSGGPPVVVEGSARALLKLGHDVTILTTVKKGDQEVVLSAWKQMIADGVKIDFCESEGISGFIGFSKSRPKVNMSINWADVVHSHCFWDPIFIIASRAAKRMNKPYFVSVHGVLDKRAMNRVILKMIKKYLAFYLFGFGKALRFSNGIIFGTEAEVQESWIPHPNLKINCVPNGVDFLKGTVPATADEFKYLDSIAPKVKKWRRTVLCRSRIHPEKGIDMLIEAFHKISKKYPDTGLLIAGLRQDLQFENKLSTLISEGQGADKIEFTTLLTGPSSEYLYSVASVFAMPSIAEGFSVALVEGLAYGRPMLVTRYCHMQVVEDVGAGLVAEPNTDSILQSLDNLLAKTDGELKLMGNLSRDLFEREYTWEQVAKKLDALYLSKGN